MRTTPDGVRHSLRANESVVLGTYGLVLLVCRTRQGDGSCPEGAHYTCSANRVPRGREFHVKRALVPAVHGGTSSTEQDHVAAEDHEQLMGMPHLVSRETVVSCSATNVFRLDTFPEVCILQSGVRSGPTGRDCVPGTATSGEWERKCALRMSPGGISTPPFG